MKTTTLNTLRRSVAGVALVTAAPAAFAQSAPSTVQIDAINVSPETVRITSTSPLVNEQENTASNVTASAEASGGGNDIYTLFGGSGSGALTLSGVTINSTNAISAQAFSNMVTNTINATTSPVFSESSAIASLQINSSAVNGTSSTSEIWAGASDSGNSADILGTLTVDDNAVSAEANGNKATNTISIADNVSLASSPSASVDFGSGGLSITGTGATAMEVALGDAVGTFAANNGTFFAGSGASEITSTAQLAVTNVQENSASITASATNDNIYVSDVNSVSGGAVSLSGNSISAAARGNEASSTVETGTGAADIDTTVAMSNLQMGTGQLSATVNNGDVRSAIDLADGASIDVDGNSVSARAYSNDVDQNLVLSANTVNADTGNRVTLHALMNEQDSAASGSGFVSGSVANYGLYAEGDLVISNLQFRTTNSTRATNVDSDIRARDNSGNGTVVTDSNISLDDNTLEAVALGSNADLNAVSIDANILGEGVGIASRQLDEGAAVSATTTSGEIVSTNAAITNSSISVDDNTVRAVAASNLSNAEIRLDVNELNVDRISTADSSAGVAAHTTVNNNANFVSGSSLIAGWPVASPYVSASLGVLNEQISNSDVSAVVSGATTIDLLGDSVDTSSLSADSNAMVAAAYGNDAASSIKVAPGATAIGSSSATALNDPLSPAEPTLDEGGDADVDNTGTTGSGTSGSGTSGSGTSGSGTSGSGTTGTGTTGGGSGEGSIPDDYANSIVAGIVTRQDYMADVLAQVEADDDMIEIQVDDALDSVLSVQDNRIEALAIANRTSENDITFRALNIDTFDEVGINVSGSTSGLRDALAGERAESQQAFTVIGAQILANDDNGSGATVTALATDSLDQGSGAVYDNLFIVGDVNGAVTTSTVNVDVNTIAATAQGNTGNNSLTLAAGARIQTTTGVAGMQEIQGTSSEVIISAQTGGGTQTTVTGAFSSTNPASTLGDGLTAISYAGTDFVNQSDNLFQNNNGSDLTFTFTNPLTAEEAAFLNGISGFSGASSGGTTVVWADGAIVDFSLFTAAQHLNQTSGSGDDAFQFNGFQQPGTATTARYDAGVIANVATGSAISSSSISVDDNTIASTATGNTLTNSLSVSAVTIQATADDTSSSADTGTLNQDGSHLLMNSQDVDATTITADAYGVFAIEDDSETNSLNVTQSTLSVSDNSQSATVRGNTATNTLSLSAITLNDGGVLNSYQDSDDSAFVATSDLRVDAPAVSNGSSITVSDNANTAAATVNTVTNTVTVSAVNASQPAETSAGASVSLQGGASPYSDTTGNVLLLNDQTADMDRTNDALNASATTTITNMELSTTGSNTLTQGGLVGGSLAMDGNTTTAEATVNRATNRLTLTGASTMDLSGALVNNQDSDIDDTVDSDEVRATATSTVVVALNGGASGTSVDQSAASVNGNRTMALANGNTAINALNVETLKAEGLPVTANYDNEVTGFAGSVTAAYVLNNTQYNDSELAASATADYGFSLNGAAGFGGTSVDTSVLNVQGNMVTAQGIGNNASNTLSMAALHSSHASISLNNAQFNDNPITASVSGSQIGMVGGADWTASSITVTDNTIRATAIANNAVNVTNRR